MNKSSLPITPNNKSSVFFPTDGSKVDCDDVKVSLDSITAVPLSSNIPIIKPSENTATLPVNQPSASIDTGLAINVSTPVIANKGHVPSDTPITTKPRTRYYILPRICLY